MATAKKRKVDAECRSFQEKWTSDYFFVEVEGKPVCLACGDALAVMKKANLERHYMSKHATLKELGGQVRLDRISALQRRLESQQAAFTDRDSVIQTSYVVSELIATKLRRHVEGEFVKECLVAAAELLAPDKVKLFQSVNLSRRTVSDQITDLAQDIEKTLKDSAGDFQFFSLACDETTDITNTAQLAVFVRGITADFDTREELLSLEAMHGTTRGVDLFEKLVLSMKKLELTFDKLSGLTTDGGPAMVGSQKGLVAFVKKKLHLLSLDPSDLIICHCIIHPESLCAQSMRLNNVMSTVVSCINFVKSRGFNSRQFKELLNDLDSEYGDLVYHCDVRWLSRGNMLTRFYEQRDEVKQFMKMKGKPVRELNDSKWLCNLAFMVDITKYLSELNVKLQCPNQLLSSLLSNVKSFEAKLRLWKVQLESNNMVHFPTLEGQKPSTTLEYAGECAKLIEAFNERFKDVKSKQMELNIFATPFNVEPADVPENLQHEIIQLQSDDELKARYNTLPLLEFYKRYISNDEFPTLRRHALKYASVFGTTYCCEQLFSKLTIAKSRLCSGLTDANLEKQLRVSTSSIPANITRLTKEKQFQPGPSGDTNEGGEMKIYCPVCNWVVLSLPALEDHMKRHRCLTEPVLFRCPHCPYSTDEAAALVGHQRTHADEEPYKCRACGEVFANPAEFCSHQNVHTRRTRRGRAWAPARPGERPYERRKPYRCSVCGAQFGQSHHLLNHERIHTGEKPYRCAACGKAFARSGTLVAHRRVHTGSKPYRCGTCGKAFKQSGALLGHEKTHTGEKPYRCADCGKGFARSRGLVVHARIHTGEKPYECAVCKKAFAQSGALCVHRRIHTGEKPYACGVCGKAFSESGTLNIHKRIHTGERPYGCGMCGKAFTHSGTLRVHRRVHTGERPFECAACGKAFSGSGELASHMRAHEEERACGRAARERARADSEGPSDRPAAAAAEIEPSVKEEASPSASDEGREGALAFDRWPGVKAERRGEDQSASSSIAKREREEAAGFDPRPTVKVEHGGRGSSDPLAAVKQEWEISPGYEV